MFGEVRGSRGSVFYDKPHFVVVQVMAMLTLFFVLSSSYDELTTKDAAWRELRRVDLGSSIDIMSSIPGDVRFDPQYSNVRFGFGLDGQGLAVYDNPMITHVPIESQSAAYYILGMPRVTQMYGPPFVSGSPQFRWTGQALWMDYSLWDTPDQHCPSLKRTLQTQSGTVEVSELPSPRPILILFDSDSMHGQAFAQEFANGLRTLLDQRVITDIIVASTNAIIDGQYDGTSLESYIVFGVHVVASEQSYVTITRSSNFDSFSQILSCHLSLALFDIDSISESRVRSSSDPTLVSHQILQHTNGGLWLDVVLVQPEADTLAVGSQVGNALSSILAKGFVSPTIGGGRP